MTELGAELGSFESASRVARKVTGSRLSTSTVKRCFVRAGRELVRERDEAAANYLGDRKRLKQVDGPPPRLGVISVDQFHVQVRARGEGRGVHKPRYVQVQLGRLDRMLGQRYERDPEPEPPGVFRDVVRLERLCRELRRNRSEPSDGVGRKASATEQWRDGEAEKREAQKRRRRRHWPPKPLYTTYVATARNIHAFGPMLAAEAYRRRFAEAERAVFLSDGAEPNWGLHRSFFPWAVPVLDFAHACTHLWEAAEAASAVLGGSWREEAVRWVRALWQGKAKELVQRWQQLEEELQEEAAVVLRRHRRYLERNLERMDYPRYRKEGLPITTACIESGCKRMGLRLRGTEKFWNEPANRNYSPRTRRPPRGQCVEAEEYSLEYAVHLRALALSDGEPIARYYAARRGNPYVGRASRLAAA